MFRVPVAVELAEVRDLSAETQAGPLACRLYHPDPARRLPLLVYYHGGGWVLGSLQEVHAQVIALAARSGCAILSVNYRLAPEHPFPAAIDDAYATLLWAAESADALGIDAARIGVGGDSAGGNLAAASAILARDRCGPPLAYQLLIYPVIDADLDRDSMHRFGEKLLLWREDMAWFWNHYCPDPALRSDPRAAPLQVPDTRGLPPAYLLLAELDPLLDEGQAYADKLAAGGVPVRCRVAPGAFHGFLGFWPLSELADRELSSAAEAVASGFSLTV
jgi:acetyl esterase